MTIEEATAEIADMLVGECGIFPDEFLDELTVRLACNPNPHAVRLCARLLERHPMTHAQQMSLEAKFELEWTDDLKWDEQTQTMTIVPLRPYKNR